MLNGWLHRQVALGVRLASLLWSLKLIKFGSVGRTLQTGTCKEPFLSQVGGPSFKTNSWKVFGKTSTIKLKRRMLNGWPRIHRQVALGVRLDYYRQGARTNIAQISLRQMKYALSWKSFARSIQSCQKHILLGARVIKGIFCHVQGLFNIVKGVLSLNRNRDIDHRNDTITYDKELRFFRAMAPDDRQYHM